MITPGNTTEHDNWAAYKDKQDAALAWAIKMFPLDLAARINYIHVRQDRCELSELFAWQYAERITRNGTH